MKIRGHWGEVTDIRRSRNEAVTTRGPGAEVISIVRPGNIIRWLTWKCGSTWRPHRRPGNIWR